MEGEEVDGAKERGKGRGGKGPMVERKVGYE